MQIVIDGIPFNSRESALEYVNSDQTVYGRLVKIKANTWIDKYSMAEAIEYTFAHPGEHTMLNRNPKQAG